MLYFPIAFNAFRRITALHTSANDRYIVVEDQYYVNNLNSTLLKVYSVDGNAQPWSIDYIIIGC